MKKQSKKQSVNERLKNTILEMANALYKNDDIDAATLREYEALKHTENKSVKKK